MARNTYTLGINSYLSQGSMHASHRFEPCTYLKYTEYIGTSYEGIMFSSKTRELSAEERVSQHRMLQRDQDYAESYFLLLELGQRNPVTCKAFHIIEAQVLHGEMCVYLRGALLQPKFQRFLNLHYFDFARQALRAMFMYGFVPWRARKLLSGDIVPEVLPAGTFTWSVVPGTSVPKNLLHLYADSSRMLLYDVKIHQVCGDVKREHVHVYDYSAASWDVDKKSFYCSQSTPLSHVVSDFKKLQHALRNRAHADQWNSQAHIITKQSTKMMGQEPTSSVLEAGYSVNPVYSYEKCQLQLHSRDDDIQEMFTKKANDHMPFVYTLPMDVSLETMPALTLCEDIDFLDMRFKQNVAFALGIPYDMLVGDGTGGKVSAAVGNNKENFKANMNNISNFLQRLMRNVYFSIYHDEQYKKTKQEPVNKGEAQVREEDIEFCLHTAPSLQIENVDELVKLASLEGALSATELKRVVQLMLYGHVLPESASVKVHKTDSTSSGNASSTTLLPSKSVQSGDKRKAES
jgi:hypothetical protein